MPPALPGERSRSLLRGRRLQSSRGCQSLAEPRPSPPSSSLLHLSPPLFAVVLGDGGRLEAWGGRSEEACFVLLMEVLDNMPHDR